MSLLEIMAERMQQTLGAESLGLELRRLMSAFDKSGQQELVARVDGLTANATKPEAVRLIRSLGGETWDQALSTFAAWRNLSKADKAKWARAVLLQKVIQRSDSTEESS